MIVAIEQHIQALAQGEQEQLRGYLRTTVPAAHLETATEQVRAFVLGVTDDLRLICAYLHEVTTPLPVRLMLASTLSYLLHPEDLLPDDQLGLYGLLDDACLLRSGLQRALPHIPKGLRQRVEASQKTFDLRSELMLKVRAYLPPGVRTRLGRALDTFEAGAFELHSTSTLEQVSETVSAGLRHLDPHAPSDSG